MSKFAFDINNVHKFFINLQEDYEEYIKEDTSSKKALRVAMGSWHLNHWIYEEFKELIDSKFENNNNFQSYLRQECKEFSIMQKICNGSKHYVLQRNNDGNDKIESTELHNGAFSDEFSRGFDISCLKIKLKDGTIIYFEDIAKKVMDFWSNFLDKELNINIK